MHGDVNISALSGALKALKVSADLVGGDSEFHLSCHINNSIIIIIIVVIIVITYHHRVLV